MEKQEPSYYSILPSKVRYDKRLTPNAKILYAEIASLTNKLGFCYANNKYFVKCYKVSIQSINFWLKNLEEYEYICRHTYRDKGTKEILNRYITIYEKPIEVNFNRPIKDFFKDNTKTSSIKSNTKFKDKNKSAKMNGNRGVILK
ncbi:helix-turn-helix domain-containing protein [Olleya namhaensis]|uniref:Helix-turn-helix domain-containing protein n=1 Tax=Olleya namhaensis TaxID=1144750 RepID=A0A1I3SS23_9FLAO|nr:helix-turn-helix domain-containing protein [Olleya namhaensis]SFJ61595.1 Helix-turn-helix domain-containing protein [Olleya namhaensis]